MTDLDASQLTTGTVSNDRLPAVLTGNGALLTNLSPVFQTQNVIDIPVGETLAPGNASVVVRTPFGESLDETVPTGTIRFDIQESPTETRLRILVKRSDGNTVGVCLGLTGGDAAAFMGILGTTL